MWFKKGQGLLGARYIKLKNLMERNSHECNVFHADLLRFVYLTRIYNTISRFWIYKYSQNARL